MKKSLQQTAWYNPEIASDMVKGALCQLEGWQKLENSDHFPILQSLLTMIPPKLKKIADIGCGAGEISRVLDSYEYTGFDLPHIIEEVALKVNPNSRYDKIDIQKVDFDIFSSFDIVLCNSFISELGNGEDILNSLFKSSPRYIILHRQEVTRLSTYSEEYKTYGDLNTLKCVLSEDCIKEFLEFYDFSCPQAYRLSTNLYSFLFKKNEIPQS